MGQKIGGVSVGDSYGPVQMRGRGGGVEVGVIMVPKCWGGSLSLELWMNLLYTISLRIPWNILEDSMTFHGFLWDKFLDIPELSRTFQNFP